VASFVGFPKLIHTPNIITVQYIIIGTPNLKLNYGDKFYFQEDNCSVYKAKKVKNFMMANNVNILEGPAKSPDLNIVEDVWKIISDTVYDKWSFHSKSELDAAIVYAITYVQTKKMDTIFDLCNGIRKRLYTVFCKQGNLFNKWFVSFLYYVIEKYFVLSKINLFLISKFICQ